MLDTNFGDFTQDTDVVITSGGGDAGLNTKAFGVSVSNDGTTWRKAVDVANNGAATTVHPVSGVSGRHVRLDVGVPTGNGEIATRLYELRVFG